MPASKYKIERKCEVCGKTFLAKTKRIIEALNRSITTPIWDKSRSTRNGAFQPKRDANGIILCKSEADKMACVYADEIRNLRQHEYNNAELFSEMNPKTIEEFREFIITAPQGGQKKGTISINTASTYFSIFKAALKKAFVDGYLMTDISATTKSISTEERHRCHGFCMA